MLVDVQDVGAGGAGGDGQVPAGVAGEPGGDLLLIGGGVGKPWVVAGIFCPGWQGNTGQPRRA